MDPEVVPGSTIGSGGRVGWRRIAAFLLSLPMQMVALALFTRTILILLAWQAGRLVPPVEHLGSPKILTVWGNWDTWHYVTIAVSGYDRSEEGVNAAFFPVYPMMIAGVKRLFGHHLQMNDYRWIAVLISMAFLVAATYALTVLFLQMATGPVASMGVVLFLISPFSFFFNAGYTESVFVFLVIVTFLAARSERWWLAAVIVAVATATRVTGVFLVPTLLLMAWKAGIGWRKTAAITAIAPLGLVAYMGWQWLHLGSPIRFITVQSHWGGFRERTWNYVAGFIDSPIGWTVNTLAGPTLLLNVGVCVVWIASLWPMYRRFGVEITFFSGMVIAQSALIIVSQGRLLLPAIGVYITLAAIVEERSNWPILKYALVASFLMTMTMLALMFANGQWIV